MRDLLFEFWYQYYSRGEEGGGGGEGAKMEEERKGSETPNATTLTYHLQ